MRLFLTVRSRFRPLNALAAALLLTAAAGVPVAAQALTWTLYNAGNAPIANDIREIRQEGATMWALGPTALYRLQNAQWTPFPLPGLFVNGTNPGGHALHVDGAGNKWVGTSEETFRLDAGTGAFTTLSTGPGGPSLRYDDDIVADALGNLFFVSAFDGLYRYDGTAATYVFGGGSMGLRRMIVSGSTYWFTTATDLVRYDGGQIRRWFTNPATFFSDLRQWNGLIWIASAQGLQRFSPATSQFQALLTPANSPLPSRSVNCLLVDRQNALWAGTQQGLARYDGTAWQVFTTTNSPMPVNDVRNLFEDAAGGIWIGTATGGLAVYRPAGVTGLPNGFTAEAASAFTLAPNPAGAAVTLHFTGPTWPQNRPQTRPQIVTVIDALGRAVRHQPLAAAASTGYEVPLVGLPTGYYTVQVTFADGRRISRALHKVAE